MFAEPAVWHALMDEARRHVLRATSRAKVARGRGRDPALRLVGGRARPVPLPRARRAVAPRILAAVDVPDDPLRHRRRAPARRRWPRAGGDVIGLDWRHPARRGLGARSPGRAVQGNLDPRSSSPRGRSSSAEAHDVLDRADGRPGHIFNLGHGVLPGDRSRQPHPPRSARAGAERHRCLTRSRGRRRASSFALPERTSCRRHSRC